jgi:hypothetical protein
LFVITVNWVIFVRYNHEISLVNYAKPNQEIDFVRYNLEFVITVIVITEFDCILISVVKIMVEFSKSKMLIM